MFESLSNSLLIFIQLLLSSFKVVGMVLCELGMKGLSIHSLKQHVLFMNLFSFILGPAVAAQLTDTQCLYYVFAAQPEV